MKPTEKKFEDHIEKYLLSQKYTSEKFDKYDRQLCLVKDLLIKFIKVTQPDKWEKLSLIHGADVDQKILARISSETTSRGIIDVLRNGVKDVGQYLDLCYFQPKSQLNPEHEKLYKENIFTVIRQLHYSTKNNNSIDMVLFLNGLPLLTMELKNQLTGQNFTHSEKQYKTDRDPKEPLLKFKRCMVHFSVDNNYVSMTTRLSGQKTVFLPFNKDLENPEVDKGYRTKYLWEDILTPRSLLDIIENFVHLSQPQELIFNEKTEQLETKTKEKLIFPRYHQLDLIRKFRTTIKSEGAGNNYLVQHTTGSGKSYSIGWLSHALISLYKNDADTKRLFDTIVVISDRTVLDDQLRSTIFSLSRTRGIVNEKKLTSQKLKENLEKGKDIVVATIQSFPFISEKISTLKDKKFAVIIDEVHSSQSGELSKELKRTLTKEDEEEVDYEKMLVEEIQSRGRQKHISFFGFTGTPKPKTLELFGSKDEDGNFLPFHIYSMYQSIHEGFTLDVLENYTTYKRYFKIKQLGEEDKRIPSDKGKSELIKYVDSHPSSIKKKVEIILDHWLKIGSKEIQGKSRGIIVTPSRKHCVWYGKEITKQLLEKGINYRCLVGFSGEVFDKKKRYTEISCNLDVGYKGDVPEGIKNPKYRLLVVANKFQTGFDEPLLQSMYVDKKLNGVQCIQTLSRLNRTISGKTRTFVLDFVNEPDEIRNSFQNFYKATFLEGETDPNRLYDFQREIFEYCLYTNEEVDSFCRIFFNPQRDDGNLHPIIDRVVDRFNEIDNEENKEFFRSRVQTYLRMYGYISQIINFVDLELEKTFIFFKYLNKKLPKRIQDRFNLFRNVDIDSLKIQKIHEGIGALVNEDSNVNPSRFDPTVFQESEYELLSEIIEQVNNEYGSNLTEEDRLDIERLKIKLEEDPEVQKFMNGENTEDDKKNFFNQRCYEFVLDQVDQRFEFYKKIEENKFVKERIFKLLYDNYLNSV